MPPLFQLLPIGLLLGLVVFPSSVRGTSWEAAPGYRWRALESRSAAAADPRLERVDGPATGLTFTNRIAESRHLTNQVLLNGSGLALGDVDGDGWTDLFLAGFDGPNALFRNLGGWKFEDRAVAAGVALPELDATGAAFGDLDGDGDLDLVLNTLGQGTWVLINDGAGTFTHRPPVLNPGAAGMSVAIADVDGDGWLDLYVTNYRTRALMDMPNTRMTFRKVGGRTVVDSVNGRPTTDPEFRDRFVVNEAGGIEENGEPDVLYRNVNGKEFVAVPWTGGAFLDEHGAPLAGPPLDWGLAAMFRDVNRDGRPDLYVCNDFQSPDRLWINQGGGKFRLAPALALRRISLSSMAVDFADVNRDDAVDFFVAEMRSRDHGWRMRWVREAFPHRPQVGVFDDRPQLEQNTLQIGRGDGTWAELAPLAGLEASEWTWGCAFVDVDLDGWEDLLVVNGMERAGRDLDVAEQLKQARSGRTLTAEQVFQGRRKFPRLAPPNLAFRNRGDLTFESVGPAWGFQLEEVSQAIALGDLDNDGDLDVVVGNLNAATAVYRTEAAAGRLAVRLKGAAPNTRGIGARIEVLGGPVAQSQEMIAGGRYLAGDDPVRVFATGAARRLTVKVTWPAGTVTELADVEPDRVVEVDEAVAVPRPDPGVVPAQSSAIRFEDRSVALAHRHPEVAADDAARQPLLPWRLSQPGPGVAWGDLDGDGDADLVVGAGSGGQPAAFRNDGRGGFIPWTPPAPAVPRDVTGLLVTEQGARRVVLMALANVEDGAALGAAVIAWDPATGRTEDVLPASEISPGTLAQADVDGDGDLDLFVAGRVRPGQWPAVTGSRVLRQDQGRWTPDAGRSQAFSQLGPVTGAVFSDFDGDGDADLAVAVELGAVRVFRQEPERWVDLTAELGLDAWRGPWTALAAADFDGDGRTDLVAGNWGRNTQLAAAFRSVERGSEAWRVYHGDLNGDGVYDVVEAVLDPLRRQWVPVQPLTVLAAALPEWKSRFPTHRQFGEADLATVLGPAAATAQVAGITTLDTVVFLQRPGRWEVRPLPLEAQWAPAMGLAVADADGDGDEDLFLAQNFFALKAYTPRLDAGWGLWLAGDGKGGFEPVRFWGGRLEGEQRGAAVADVDGDGRVDLAVGQNGGATRWFRNVGARPGVRVRVVGPASNPRGIGMQLRWKGSTGPLREVRSGSGGLSQDDAVGVLGVPDTDAVLEVRRPGGTPREMPVGRGTNEVRVEW